MAKKNKTKDEQEVLEVDNDQAETVEVESDGKKDKKDKKTKKKSDKKGGKAKGFLTLILLMLTMASAIGYIFLFNGFGLRDNYLRSYIENIPFLASYLPPATEEATMGELVINNKDLVSENELLKQQLAAAETVAQNSIDEIERLKLIEAQQTDFVEMKEEFDSNFAKMTSTDFLDYYEEMYPDVAEEVYSELISDIYDKNQVDDYIETFKTMEPDAIAGILEVMINTDMELVVLIMDNIDKKLAGEVLSAMEPTNAASVVRLMSPENY